MAQRMLLASRYRGVQERSLSSVARLMNTTRGLSRPVPLARESRQGHRDWRQRTNGKDESCRRRYPSRVAQGRGSGELVEELSDDAFHRT